MKSTQPIAPVEQYEPPSGAVLGTVTDLTLDVCGQYPSTCQW
jgi:hypothetical protein